MIVGIFVWLFLVCSVSCRLDLEPLEPDPSPPTGHCDGPNCPIQGVNDEPVGFTCNGTETSFHPDVSDCHNYFICYKGNATHQTCPPDMAYGRDVKLCIAERLVKECHNSVICESNGVLPDSKNCTRYHYCYYGYPYHFTCPNGTRFDPVSRRCSSTVPCITDKNLILNYKPTPFDGLGGPISTFAVIRRKLSKFDELESPIGNY